MKCELSASTVAAFFIAMIKYLYLTNNLKEEGLVWLTFSEGPFGLWSLGHIMIAEVCSRENSCSHGRQEAEREGTTFKDT